MEALDKVGQGLLWPFLDLGEVNASTPLLVTGDELADEPISQVLETRDTF